MIGSAEFQTSVTITPKWISKPCHQYHDLSLITGYHQMSFPCYSISFSGGKYLERHHRHLPATNCQRGKITMIGTANVPRHPWCIYVVAFHSLRVFLSSSSDQFSDNSPALATGATILMNHQQWRTNLQGQIQVWSTLFHHWHSLT